MKSNAQNEVTINGKRQQIINSAQILISIQGFKHCSISDIAKDAGVADSILYHYFVNKEDLLFAACAARLEKAKEEVEFQLHGIVDPMSKLGKVIWYHLHMNDFDSENAAVIKNLLLECQSRKEFYDHECFAVLQTYSKITKNILDEGVQQGVFSASLNTSLVTTMIFGLLDAESLSRFIYNEVEKTIPDFEPIMQMISAILTDETTSPPPRF